MKEYWTNEEMQKGKVVWKVAPDFYPELFVVFRNGKFGFFSSDWVCQGCLSGECNPIGEPYGYDSAYVCDIKKLPPSENASAGGYLALQRNGRWMMYAIDLDQATLVIEDEPSIESIQSIVYERIWLRMEWKNLLEDAWKPWKEIDHTPDKITELEPYQIFVFGSNLDGKHLGGAAKDAYEKFGAKWGQGIGLQGQSYAIPTMNLSLDRIEKNVQEFTDFARCHPEYQFLVTRIGCGIAGFKDKDIARLFQEASYLRNIVFPKSWHEFL